LEKCASKDQAFAQERIAVDDASCKILRLCHGSGYGSKGTTDNGLVSQGMGTGSAARL
jgi:hypothetical protein